MSLTFDEYGRPFIIIREQGKKMRLKGRDAQKVAFHNSLIYHLHAYKQSGIIYLNLSTIAVQHSCGTHFDESSSDLSRPEGWDLNIANLRYPC